MARTKKKKKAKTHKIKKSTVPVGTREYATASVASPYGGGHVESVRRVVDPIDNLLAKDLIDRQQFDAAQTYRHAFDMLTGSMGGVMDPEKVRGAGTPGSPPGPSTLIAADRMNEAAKILGMIDGTVVKLVAGEGRSIEEAAAILCGVVQGTGEPTARDKDRIGARLKDSLSLLGKAWHPTALGREGNIRTYIAPEQVETVPDVATDQAPATS